MNGSSKHTLYGVIFIAMCIAFAGILYAVIRSPNPSETANTNSTQQSSVDLMRTTAVAAADPSPDHPDTATQSTAGGDEGAKLGMCRMGGCSWSKTLEQETVKTDARGQLIKLTLLGGSSTSEKSRVTWNAKSHEVYVFCSTALPAVMIADGSKWQVDVLDLVNGVPGVLESALSLYGDTCHGGDAQFPDDAGSLGYTPLSDTATDVQIAQPTEIFDRVELAR